MAPGTTADRDAAWEAAVAAAVRCLSRVAPLTNYAASPFADRDLMRRKLNACNVAEAYRRALHDHLLPDEPPVADPRNLAAQLAKAGKCTAAARKAATPASAAGVLLDCLHAAWEKTPRVRASPAPDARAWESHLALQGYSMLAEIFLAQLPGHPPGQGQPPRHAMTLAPEDLLLPLAAGGGYLPLALVVADPSGSAAPPPGYAEAGREGDLAVFCRS